MKTCKVCKKQVDQVSPDPCFGMLPGVKNACCGHGEQVGYIAFENGITIYFDPKYIIDYDNLPPDAHDENGFVKRSTSAKVDFEVNS